MNEYPKIKQIQKVDGSDAFINLCWHPITCLLPDGKYHHWEASSKGNVARVEYHKITGINGRFKKKATYINLPNQQKDITYIVSRDCLIAAKMLYPERNDLVSPGDQNPDENQQIKYCIGWLEEICY